MIRDKKEGLQVCFLLAKMWVNRLRRLLHWLPLHLLLLYLLLLHWLLLNWLLLSRLLQ